MAGPLPCLGLPSLLAGMPTFCRLCPRNLSLPGCVPGPVQPGTGWQMRCACVSRGGKVRRTYTQPLETQPFPRPVGADVAGVQAAQAACSAPPRRMRRSPGQPGQAAQEHLTWTSGVCPNSLSLAQTLTPFLLSWPGPASVPASRGVGWTGSSPCGLTPGLP